MIAPDMRGLGDSSRPLTGYDKRTIGNDIWRLVSKKLGHQRFLVGHDRGGPTTYAIWRIFCWVFVVANTKFPSISGRLYNAA